jgi:hypothetical protein
VKVGWHPSSVPAHASSSSATSRPSSRCQRSGRDSRLIVTIQRLHRHGHVHVAIVVDDGGVDIDTRQMDFALANTPSSSLRAGASPPPPMAASAAAFALVPPRCIMLAGSAGGSSSANRRAAREMAMVTALKRSGDKRALHSSSISPASDAARSDCASVTRMPSVC